MERRGWIKVRQGGEDKGRKVYALNDLGFIPEKLRDSGVKPIVAKQLKEARDDRIDDQAELQQLIDKAEYSKFDPKLVKRLREAKEQIHCLLGKDTIGFKLLLRRIKESEARIRNPRQKPTASDNIDENAEKIDESNQLVSSKYAVQVFDPHLLEPEGARNKHAASIENGGRKKSRMKSITSPTKTKEPPKLVRNKPRLADKLNALELQLNNKPVVISEKSKPKKLVVSATTKNKNKVSMMPKQPSLRKMSMKAISRNQARRVSVASEASNVSSAPQVERRATNVMLPAYVLHIAKRKKKSRLMREMKPVAVKSPDTHFKASSFLSKRRKIAEPLSNKLSILGAQDYEYQKVLMNRQHEAFFTKKATTSAALCGKVFLQDFRRPELLEAKTEAMVGILKPKKRYRKLFIKRLEMRKNLTDLRLFRCVSSALLSRKYAYTLNSSHLSWFTNLLTQIIFTDTYYKMRNPTIDLTNPERIMLMALNHYLVHLEGTISRNAIEAFFAKAVKNTDHQSPLLLAMTSHICFDVLNYTHDEYFHMLKRNQISLPDTKLVGRKKSVVKSVSIGAGLRAMTYGLKWKRIWETEKKKRIEAK